ncbi:hypothetical protein MIDIC_310011 [Alphaproteobacteria bacterium]
MRKHPRGYDVELYKERNLRAYVQQIKVFLKVATRYDKLDVAYLSFVFIARIYLWLK